MTTEGPSSLPGWIRTGPIHRQDQCVVQLHRSDTEDADGNDDDHTREATTEVMNHHGRSGGKGAIRLRGRWLLLASAAGAAATSFSRAEAASVPAFHVLAPTKTSDLAALGSFSVSPRGAVGVEGTGSYPILESPQRTPGKKFPSPLGLSTSSSSSSSSSSPQTAPFSSLPLSGSTDLPWREEGFGDEEDEDDDDVVFRMKGRQPSKREHMEEQLGGGAWLAGEDLERRRPFPLRRRNVGDVSNRRRGARDEPVRAGAGPGEDFRDVDGGGAKTSVARRSGTSGDASSTGQPGAVEEGEGSTPSWLPYLFTTAQLESLRVPELKEACGERGLRKSGNKAELRDRLRDWRHRQHEQRVAERRGARKTPLDDVLEYHRRKRRERKDSEDGDSKRGDVGTKLHGVRDGDDWKGVNELGGRRRGTRDGRGSGLSDEGEDDDLDDDRTFPSSLPAPKEDYVSALNRAFHAETAGYSNLQVQRMYQDAKRADQRGEKRLAREILLRLRDATPADGRVVRRLARLAAEMGNDNEARRLLQDGVRVDPRNGHLWHGLGQLELEGGRVEGARECFKRAILAERSLPNPYHAWGRLEQAEGNVRAAAALFRRGLRVSPRNHRLWHALGGLYREAGMLREATHAFEKGMSYGPNWSRSFFCTALAYVAYDAGDVELARRRLREGVERDGRKHAQGWLALAQLEESEGRLVEARNVYNEAVNGYERGRNILRQHDIGVASADRPTPFVIPKRSGDKWNAVYQSWARMEESHNNFSAADDVYERAAQVFPDDSHVFCNWAKLQGKLQNYNRARLLFEQACHNVGTSNSEPYRAYAESEMRLENFELAREIFFAGAAAGSQSSDGQERGLASLMHSWAKCEWKLGDVDRAGKLYDRALQLTESKDGSDERGTILASMARFESSPQRRNYRMAQHCICLAIKEDANGPRSVEYWRLWGDIAEKMDNGELASDCFAQAETAQAQIEAGLLNPAVIKGLSLKKLLCKAPWHKKLFQNKETN